MGGNNASCFQKQHSCSPLLCSHLSYPQTNYTFPVSCGFGFSGPEQLPKLERENGNFLQGAVPWRRQGFNNEKLLNSILPGWKSTCFLSPAWLLVGFVTWFIKMSLLKTTVIYKAPENIIVCGTYAVRSEVCVCVCVCAYACACTFSKSILQRWCLAWKGTLDRWRQESPQQQANQPGGWE